MLSMVVMVGKMGNDLIAQIFVKSLPRLRCGWDVDGMWMRCG